MTISSEQIKAARAWLGWTRELLAAEAGISPSTVRNLEEGKLSHRSVETVRVVYENRGFKFQGKHGITRQPAEIRTFTGPDSCNDFYDDLLKITKQKKQEIVAIFKSQHQLALAIGITDFNNLERLEELTKHVSIKCLLSDNRPLSLNPSAIHFRTTLQNPLGPLAQMIFGDTTAVIIYNGREFIFHVLRSIETANIGLKDFGARWIAATPLVTISDAVR